MTVSAQVSNASRPRRSGPHRRACRGRRCDQGPRVVQALRNLALSRADGGSSHRALHGSVKPVLDDRLQFGARGSYVTRQRACADAKRESISIVRSRAAEAQKTNPELYFRSDHRFSVLLWAIPGWSLELGACTDGDIVPFDGADVF